MALGSRWFLFNRQSDWEENSIMSNVYFENDSMISNNKSGENAVYISGPIDSTQNEMEWYRLRIDSVVPPNAIYKLRIYTSDTFDIYVPKPGSSRCSNVDINEFIFDESIDINTKIDTLEYAGAKCYENPTDILLYDFKGRYIWFCLEMINHEVEPIKINSMKIEFPSISFIELLPEVYREDEKSSNFLKRFLGVFQSIYLDMDDKIDYAPINFDSERCSREFLNWIADWLSVKDISLWGDDRLRKFLKKCVSIYKIKGTKRAISRIVEEYIGVEPMIVEQFDVKDNMYYEKQKDVVENLFGDNGYVFTVMLPESQVKSNESYVELLKVISTVKPIDAICNLVVLNDRIYLDHHCYIGINSFVSRNEDMVLDGEHKDVSNLVIANDKV